MPVPVLGAGADADAGPGMNERFALAGPEADCADWRPASMAVSESERCAMPAERLARSLRAFLPEPDLQRDVDFGLGFVPVDALLDSD